MIIRFWGVRGSIPSPLQSKNIQSKISAILELIKLEDIRNASSRERFLARLPPSLFGTIGGNTPCVEINTDSAGSLIFDAGTGIRELGLNYIKNKPKKLHYRIFFTHFHWDHIQGLPFFAPAFDPSVAIDFYACQDAVKNYLDEQMELPYFPVTMNDMAATKKYIHIRDKLNIEDVEIRTRAVNHPGGCYAFAISEKGKRIIYATDIELNREDFLITEANSAFFNKADVLIMDSQYTLEEAIKKPNWGHNAFSVVTEFANAWHIKKLILFHHDPTYDDRKLYGNLDAAKKYMDRMGYKETELFLALEGMELSV